LRDYTTFVEAHGDAAAADLLRAYRELVRAEVARHTGAEVKTEGDSFYVVFESPSAALECAVAIQRAAHEHASHGTGAPIRVGIGLHAGETVPYDDQFVGSAVNVAARLASKAKSGEIVASDTLRGLVRTQVRHEMDDRGPLRLKGVGERVRAWSVEWREATAPPPEKAPVLPLPLLAPTVGAAVSPAPGQIVCPIVVGRDAEHARFGEILSLAAEGRGQAVVLAGEAGVGKSAFVRDSIAAASRVGFRVLYGATLESDKGLPYAPFVSAVRSGFRGIARDRLGRVLTQAAPDLAQLFPELGKAQRAEGASAVEQHRLSVAFLGLFSTFAREAPVLVIVEDLHWADEASLGLFHYLARELRDARVVLLGTYRSDEMHRRHPFLRALGTMQRERVVAEITLGRLDKEQVRALIDATFRQKDPNIKITDEFRDAIYARSEGNPFFTEELLKSLVESGDLYFKPDTGWVRDKPIDQLRIPGSVREAVRERSDRLSPDAQVTLSAASVFGLRVPFELLRAIRGLPEAELEAHLRELIEQQLTVELGGDDDEYGFRHALTKEVVYDDLLVRERKRLHRGVADALARDGQAEPALVAHHLIAAGEGAAAIPHLVAAAERAWRAYAPREAVAHYEQAIDVGITGDDLPGLMERLAEAYHLFDYALSRKTAEEAGRLYRERADPRGESRMLRLVSRNLWQQGDPDRAAVVARAAIDTLAGQDETAELGRATANLATLRMLARADEESLELSERAIEIGRRFADAWTIAQAQVTKGTTLARLDWAAGTSLIREGVDLAIREGLAETAARGYNNLLVSSGPRSGPEQDALFEKATAYLTQHGLGDAPMLRSGKAFDLWRKAEWDRSIVLAESVPEGSFWRRGAIATLSWIALGREGPARAVATREPSAREEIKSQEAQTFAPAAGNMGVFHLHARSKDHAAEWFRILTARAEADPGVARVLAFGPAFFAIALAAGFDDETWLDRLEDALPEDPGAAEFGRTALATGRAIFALDGEACARAVAAQHEAMASRGWGAFATPAILAAEAVLDRGVTLGPTWRAPFAASREFSVRARAPWYLAKLDELEAKIRD
ncbi:MAG TPA: AAA family ATPase, partial [Candidatus Limnocylindria bacterium]|nr:AAA family ATPase [Candidatus Limnocylindria bacterium]